MKNEEFLNYFNLMKKLTDFVYEDSNLLHIEALSQVIGYILGEETELDLETYSEEFSNEVEKLDEIVLERDEVLKALQLLMLESFKRDELNLSNIIPSKIGIMFGFILKKLMIKHDHLKIMDPNIGTGNLLIHAVKDLENNREIQFFGADINPIFTELSKRIFNLLNYDIKLYLQDSLTITPILKIDYVVSNVESFYLENNRFYPFEFIKKYSVNLNKNGYMILLLDDNFFKNKELSDFKREINGELKMQGIIALPHNLFKNNIKHICIFQKTTVEIDKFFICELPEFENSEKFNHSLNELNHWLNQKGEETCKK